MRLMYYFLKTAISTIGSIKNQKQYYTLSPSPCLYSKTDNLQHRTHRPPTLLVHGLCIRVRHRETDRVLKVKSGSTTTKKDQWAAVSRQGVRGSHLRLGTKKEVTSSLAATFASRIQERDWGRYYP